MSELKVSCSRSFSASNHCIPSPNGQFIATLTSSDISVRSTSSLQVVHIVDLPWDLSGPILSFKWSPSSQYLLVAVAEQIHVFSAQEGSNLHAIIRNPTPPAVKPCFIDFGATDSEVILFSSLGLRLSIFNLKASKTVEISSPKFYSISSAHKSFSIRPISRHFAVLTRTDGKDVVSVHHPETRECQRSWPLDTIDANGITWSPDGRWLAAWESPAHGHKILFYTADGNLFKLWSGPHHKSLDKSLDVASQEEFALAPGVKRLQFSHNSRYLAVADFSRTVYSLDMTMVAETATLCHPPTITPRDDGQVWQEQLITADDGEAVSGGFIKATQAVSPTGRPTSDHQELKTGPFRLSFDGSSALVATALAEWPSTVWIWDASTATLRAVLLFHFSISSLAWHPRIPETLLITCEVSEDSGTAYIWTTGNAPVLINFPQEHIPVKPHSTSRQSVWLALENNRVPVVVHSNGSHYAMAAVLRSNDGLTPWRDELGQDGQAREESPLELVPAFSSARSRPVPSDSGSDLDSSDDTFHFKKKG
ncbi:hypothetical protein MCOR20_004320 [Pyricularia oryzae]|nr:hypothetical protein MCOR20_004320 [Pyricularia oryzae]